MNRLLVLLTAMALADAIRPPPIPEDENVEQQTFAPLPDTGTVDPRFQDLIEKAEKVVKKSIQNVTVESASLMNKLISTVELVDRDLGSGECADGARDQLTELKQTTLDGIGMCPERLKVEQASWALAISSALVTADVHRAAHEALNLCLRGTTGYVLCRPTAGNVNGKAFEEVKTKVDELAMNATKMYTDVFLPFAEHCVKLEAFNAAVQAIKTNCSSLAE